MRTAVGPIASSERTKASEECVPSLFGTYVFGVRRPVWRRDTVESRSPKQVNGRLQPVRAGQLLLQRLGRGRHEGPEMVVQLGLQLLPALVQGGPELAVSVVPDG